tara:strand:+ start:1278 stop:1688 length:411 start_codon:yes stop_codon:yes gene_type:complete
MNAKLIIENLLNGDAYSTKSNIEDMLYIKTGKSIKRFTPNSVSNSFNPENAAFVLDEAEQSPEQKAYRALFDRILKKYGVDSPNDLEDSKKDDFFNEVEKEWKKDPANDDEGVGEEKECIPCQKRKKQQQQQEFCC